MYNVILGLVSSFLFGGVYPVFGLLLAYVLFIMEYFSTPNKLGYTCQAYPEDAPE